MTDKQFWLTVRRALLMVVRAIEKKYDIAEKVPLEADATTTVSVAFDE